MKKSIIFLLVWILFVMYSCDFTNTTESSIIFSENINRLQINDITNGRVLDGKIHFGIKKSELFDIMNENKLTFFPSNAEIDDPDEISGKDGSILLYYEDKIDALYRTNDYSFVISDQGFGTLIAINLHGENIQTDAGLKIGDSVTKIEQVYGKDFEIQYNSFGSPYHIYEFEKTFLMIGYQNDKIVSIRFSLVNRW